MSEPLPFCEEYSEYSCCDADYAREIKETVNELMVKECPRCYALVKEWKCGECHPAAGILRRFVVLNATGLFHPGQRASIRFCEDYCQAIFEICKDIPFDLDRGAFYINEPPDITKEEWCEGKTAPEGRCFRGIIPDNLEGDTHCKCPEHDCEDSLKKWVREERKRKKAEKMKKEL